MKFKFILGVDVSKNWFNYCIMTNTLDLIQESKVDNNPKAIEAFLESLFKESYLDDMDQILLILEHTGIYVKHLVNAWLGQTGKLSIVHSSKVSNLLSGQTSWDEKTDAMDARRLSEYAIRYADKIKLWQAKDTNLELLQELQTQRKRTNKILSMLTVPLNESKKFNSKEIKERLTANHLDLIKETKKALKEIDRQLMAVINDDQNLKHLYKLITSVEGVGPVTAREVLICTSGFIDFLPTQAKSFAKYCGVVPLPKQSGKVNRKAKTSKRANMKLKSYLTMGATALIGTKSELGKYYQRKVEEGKPHFKVINAMRNKMILRIFAVVKNNTMYQKNLDLN